MHRKGRLHLDYGVATSAVTQMDTTTITAAACAAGVIYGYAAFLSIRRVKKDKVRGALSITVGICAVVGGSVASALTHDARVLYAAAFGSICGSLAFVIHYWVEIRLRLRKRHRR